MAFSTISPQPCPSTTTPFRISVYYLSYYPSFPLTTPSFSVTTPSLCNYPSPLSPPFPSLLQYPSLSPLTIPFPGSHYPCPLSHYPLFSIPFQILPILPAYPPISLPFLSIPLTSLLFHHPLSIFYYLFLTNTSLPPSFFISPTIPLGCPPLHPSSFSSLNHFIFLFPSRCKSI